MVPHIRNEIEGDGRIKKNIRGNLDVLGAPEV